MAARNSSFRKPGGFLNEVDGTIVDYKFTDEFNGQPFVPDKVRDNKTGKIKDRHHAMNAVVSVLVDGATEPVSTHLYAGGWEFFTVTDNGRTVKPVRDGGGMGYDTAWSKFIQSIEELGTPCENADYPEGTYNYEPIINLRVRLTQQEDAKATASFGKVKNKEGVPTYSRKNLVAGAVYGYVAGAAAKSSSKAKVNGSGDLAPEAVKAVVSVLEDAGGSIAKSQLNVKLLTKLLGKPNKEAIKKVAVSDDFLAGNDDVWEYDGTTISLVEVSA